MYDFSLSTHSSKAISLCNAPKYDQNFKQNLTTHQFEA
ncbi:hypothetical protein L293_0563 [Acinetobacter gyllenbergii CIP 110306 = MTCC 11365]|nr:hypothetical protein L293_0563 [Acinetobacter gyllenbergii CIP 110306 = MTCC 11365]